MYGVWSIRTKQNKQEFKNIQKIKIYLKVMLTKDISLKSKMFCNSGFGRCGLKRNPNFNFYKENSNFEHLKQLVLYFLIVAHCNTWPSTFYKQHISINGWIHRFQIGLFYVHTKKVKNIRN